MHRNLRHIYPASPPTSSKNKRKIKGKQPQPLQTACNFCSQPSASLQQQPAPQLHLQSANSAVEALPRRFRLQPASSFSFRRQQLPITGTKIFQKPSLAATTK
ncbi:hypothetical protein M758_UG298800 [Ceratodon purpureus]|nr:hypothetical protein M758_UG298800 [Ceratodon purpureus]